MLYSSKVLYSKRKRTVKILFIFLILANSCTRLTLANNFIEIGFELNKEEIELSLLEKLYLNGEYSKIVILPIPNDNFQKYIYIRALYHLKEHEKIVKNNFDLDDPVLGKYLTFFKINSLVELKQFEKALEEFKNIEKDEELLQKDNLIDLYEKIVAGLDREDISINKGRFYFYRFEITKDKNYLIKAVEQKDSLAINSLYENIRLIPASTYLKIFDFIKNNNIEIALKVAIYIKLQNELGELYFQNKKYKEALNYLNKDSIYYSLSKIALEKPDENDINVALNNLELSYDILATWYIKTKNYEMLYDIIVKTKKIKYIRELILILLEKKEYEKLYEYAINLKDQISNQYFKTMILYYAGYTNINNKKNDAIEILKECAINTFIFYGYQSFIKLSDEDKKDVIKRQKEIYEKSKSNIKEKIKLMTNIKLTNEEYIKFFIKIGEYNRAINMLKTKIEDENKINFFLFSYLFNLKRYRLALYFLNKIYDYLTEYKIPYIDIVKYLVPLPDEYKEIIIKASKRYNIDVYLITGLIRQESVFDEKAVSIAGAKGLTQLMDSTAKPIITKLYKEKIIENTDIFDPNTNIMVGIFYLHDLFNTYKDYNDYKEILAIASYNAGPIRIKKHFINVSSSVLNNIHFIDTIPITETREYVKRVLFYKEVYKTLYRIEE
ncbi:MAG TPA: transglycosylase SLT domain-containing protein [Spirochaetota bacterium]|nr:transglycosylase SLT domain-containing protein [Spirochaetota bacterium]HOM37749.1 transglycosylase SLT domain-containing protein [Spirochaetota bacterium]HPQ49374.1 transglycosylase SLT domain-containing protein [Spirochaetota bacterium]